MRTGFRASILSVATATLMIAATAALAEAQSAGDTALFERLDANADGLISADEVPQDHKRLFTRLLRKAEAEGDRSLSRDEFLAALIPSRPEKPIEEKQPTTSPQAEAVRYLLLTMDASGNSSIDADEVPKDLQPIFEAMAERLDANKNDTLDRYELSRGFGALSQIAARYVARERVDIAAELKKLEKSQGKAARRFDEQQQQPMLENLSDRRQARAMFAQLDGNGDGKVEPAEVPERFQPQLERFMRLADRDRDGRLSEREFLAGAERVSRFLGRQQPEQAPNRDAKPERRSRDAE